MKMLDVKLNSSSYSVYIQPGLLHNIGTLISEWYTGKNIALVTDINVDLLYSDSLITALETFDYEVNKIVVPAGEQSKSLDTLDFIYNRLAESGISRNSLVIAFGGGVVGDLTGFAAATFMRGVPYIHIPTTVMSQLDSSIGGKTAVNISAGKNLAGCFYQPKAVYMDTLLLESLSDKIFADGIAEAIKYGAIKDANLFAKMQNMQSLKDAKEKIYDIIIRCAEIKCEVVSSDEFDRGERMLLNFGHTIGHGLEKYFGYKSYSHGEAVGLGMMTITKNSEAMGITKTGTLEEIKELLTKLGLPVNYRLTDINKLLHLISVDKKSTGDFINLILLKEIGNAYIHKASKEELINFIK